MAWTDFLSPKRRLQNKILFPFLLVTVIITILATWWVGRIITQNFETRADDLLNNHRKFVTKKIKEIEERNIFYAHFVADVIQLASYFPQPHLARSVLIYLMEFIEKNHMDTSIVGETFTDEARRQLIQRGLYGFRVTDLIERSEKDSVRLSIDAVSLIGERPKKSKEVVVLSYPLDSSFLEKLKDKTEADITLIYKGRLVLSTLADKRDLALLQQNLGPDLFSRLVEENETFVAEFGYEGARHRAICFPFSVGSENVGAFAVSMSLKQLHKMRGEVIRNILWSGIGVLISVLALYSFFSRKITKPIKELSLASKRIAEGDLDLEIKKGSQDEVGELEDAFSQMSKKLKASYDRIRQDKEQLEQKVALRTRELEQINRTLRESEQKYRNLFENANDCIFIIEPDTLKFLDVNRRAELTYGYSKSEFAQMKLSQIALKQGGKNLSEDWWKSIRKYPASFFNQAHVRKDGAIIHTDVNANLIDYAGSKVILLITRDVTERKKLESQLIQSSKLASLGELAAGVAHEIGNPLSAISNYSQFLSLGRGTEAEIRESLDGIKAEISRIDEIIKNLLTFSRPSPEEITDVDINEIITSAVSLISHQRLFRNIKLNKLLATDYPRIKADRNQLIQVFVNILLNSAQAMPEGGIIQIRSIYQDGRLKVQITDTGIGIPKENLSKIFDPFFTTKLDGVGTGLGLSIVYRIIEKFNGLIEAESPAVEKLAEDARGTTFTITFPG
jgi:PAS domain S-box-containing protein